MRLAGELVPTSIMNNDWNDKTNWKQDRPRGLEELDENRDRVFMVITTHS